MSSKYDPIHLEEEVEEEVWCVHAHVCVFCLSATFHFLQVFFSVSHYDAEIECTVMDATSGTKPLWVIATLLKRWWVHLLEMQMHLC